MYTSWLLHWASLGFNIDLTEEKGGGLGLIRHNQRRGSISENTSTCDGKQHGNSERNGCQQPEDEEHHYDEVEKERPRKRRRNDVCQEVMQMILFKKVLLSPSTSAINDERNNDDDESEGEYEMNFHDEDTVVMSNHEPWLSDGNNAEDLNMITKPTCCSLCMQDFDSDSKIVRSKCYKYFHRQCILEWMQSKNDSCPDCGAAIWDHIEFTVDVEQEISCSNKGNPQESQEDAPDLCDELSVSTITEMDSFDTKKFDEENQVPPMDIIIKEQPSSLMALRKRRRIDERSTLNLLSPPCVFVNNVNNDRDSAVAA